MNFLKMIEGKSHEM